MELIMILGSPNTNNKQLYDVAVQRCQLTIKEYPKHPDAKFLLTGGYEAHFNQSPKPHAAYLAEYLIQAGIPKDSILEYAESSNTIEDATLSKPIIEKYQVTDITIITSDYHLTQAEYIFREIYRGLPFHLTFLGAKSDEERSGLDIKALKQHEANALEKLKKHRLENYYSGGK